MELDKELYNEIKAYCALNNLKTRDYIHNLLKKAFMEDKYGKMPLFMKKKEVEKANEEFTEIVENVGGTEKFNEIVNECIMKDEVTEQKEQSKIEPEKKVVKIIKRKLNE